MQRLTIRRNRLVLPAKVIPYEEWLELGSTHLAPAVSRLAWVVGDWLFYAYGEYGGRDQNGRDLLGLDAALLRDFMEVAAACANDMERDPSVPWGKYLLALKRDGRRITGDVASQPLDRCGGCRGPLYSLTKHERRYCSNACRQRAYRLRKAAEERSQ